MPAGTNIRPLPPAAATAKQPVTGSGYCAAANLSLAYGGAGGWVNAGCALTSLPSICEVIPAGPQGRVAAYRWALLSAELLH